MAAKLDRMTHKIAIQLNLVAESLYHLQFSLQMASPETFGYILVGTTAHRIQTTLHCFSISIFQMGKHLKYERRRSQ
jgi:hypothetical protein